MILPCYWSRIMGESGEDPDLLVLKYDENEDRSALLMVQDQERSPSRLLIKNKKKKIIHILRIVQDKQSGEDPLLLLCWSNPDDKCYSTIGLALGEREREC